MRVWGKYLYTFSGVYSGGSQSSRTCIFWVWRRSEGHKAQHRHVVSILLTKKVAKSMMGFHVVSDRVLIVKLARKPFNIIMIQLHAPTSPCLEDDIEKLYSE